MTISNDIKGLVSIFVEGLDVISKWNYKKDSPFEKLQSAIVEELNSIQKFNFKSNNSYPLFREEIKTMTGFMRTSLNEIIARLKSSPERKKEVGVPAFRPIHVESIKEPIFQFAFVGTLPTQIPTENDTLIQKFLKNSLTLIKSLKNLCGTKFSQFFEVLEELFGVILTELF